MRRLLVAGLLVALLTSAARAETFTPTRSVVYKTIGDVVLRLEIFEPADMKPTATYPGIVLFFGGGWQNGEPKQLYPQCARFAQLGMVAISAEYRIQSKHHTSPRESVMDGKSCLRWIQAHAAELHIDPSRLVAGGASAGGHVAMAAAVVPGLNEPGEKTDPIALAALILFNPVIDNGPGGYGYDRVKDYYLEISPLHNLHPGIPPTLAQFGTKDKFVPVATAEKFKSEMIRLGNRCDVIEYDDQVHGFFNYKEAGNPYYEKTMAAAEAFLRSNRILPASP